MFISLSLSYIYIYLCIYIYIYLSLSLYIYIYIYIHTHFARPHSTVASGAELKGQVETGLAGRDKKPNRTGRTEEKRMDSRQRRVQWMGGAVDGGTGGETSRTLTQTFEAQSVSQIQMKSQATTPAFHYTPLCGM